MTQTPAQTVHQSINNEYEWIQYNSDLRIIRSINDDMYQCKSILSALDVADKEVNNWIRNKQTQELLASYDEKPLDREFAVLAKTHEIRNDVAIELRGYYIHRKLVPIFAMWANVRYARKIIDLLDNIFDEERKEMEEALESKDTVILNQATLLTDAKPRKVAAGFEKDYVIAIKFVPEYDTPKFTALHIRRRHKSTFRAVAKEYTEDSTFMIREGLTNAMSCTYALKMKLWKGIPFHERVLKGSLLLIDPLYIDEAFEILETTFNEYQE